MLWFKLLLYGCVTLIGGGMVQNEVIRESVTFIISVNIKTAFIATSHFEKCILF